MPDQSSETPFTVNIVGDRIIEYSERDLTAHFAFDLNLTQGPKCIFLETKPLAGPTKRLAPGIMDRNQLTSILDKVVKSMNSKGYTITLVND